MRLTLFILLALASLLSPWWLVLGISIAYALKWPGYELIVLGMLVDSTFWHNTTIAVPFYTIAGTMLVVAVTFLRPYLAAFDEPYESI